MWEYVWKVEVESHQEMLLDQADDYRLAAQCPSQNRSMIPDALRHQITQIGRWIREHGMRVQSHVGMSEGSAHKGKKPSPPRRRRV